MVPKEWTKTTTKTHHCKISRTSAPKSTCQNGFHLGASLLFILYYCAENEDEEANEDVAPVMGLRMQGTQTPRQRRGLPNSALNQGSFSPHTIQTENNVGKNKHRVVKEYRVYLSSINISHVPTSTVGDNVSVLDRQEQTTLKIY